MVPEIFKSEECAKCAYEMTDDVINWTQFYIKYIHRAILINLQRRPLKLDKPIVLQGTHLQLQTFCSHSNSLFSSPHSLDFKMSVIFSSQNIKRSHKLGLTSWYACWIKQMRHHLQISKWNTEGGQKCLNIGEVCHDNHSVALILWILLAINAQCCKLVLFVSMLWR